MCGLLHNLVYERIDEISVLSNFYCGIEKMDNFIHNNLEKRLSENDGLEFFLVKMDESIVALVALKKSYIELRIKEAVRLDSLEIEYLAVKKECQKKHIGTQILSWVQDRVDIFFKESHLLSVRAYRDIDTGYTAESFYKSCGFKVVKEPHPLADNVIMAKRL